MSAEVEIGLFKLISGEEVVAKYVDDGEFYILNQPRRVFAQQMPNGQMGIKMMPWIIGNPDGVFPVHTSHVITPSAQIEEGLKTGYLQQTTGIDLSSSAPKNLVV